MGNSVSNAMYSLWAKDKEYHSSHLGLFNFHLPLKMKIIRKVMAIIIKTWLRGGGDEEEGIE